MQKGWPVTHRFYSLRIRVPIFSLITRRPVNTGCFHSQNGICKDHYPIPIFATNYLCGKSLFVWILIYLSSHWENWTSFIHSFIIYFWSEALKVAAGELENLCSSQSPTSPWEFLRRAGFWELWYSVSQPQGVGLVFEWKSIPWSLSLKSENSPQINR